MLDLLQLFLNLRTGIYHKEIAFAIYILVYIYVYMLRHWFQTRQNKLPKFRYRRSTCRARTRIRTTAPIRSTSRLCSPLIKVKAPRRKRGKRRRKYAVRLARASDGRQNAGPSRARPPRCIPRAWQMISITHFICKLFFRQFEIESKSLFIANFLGVILPGGFLDFLSLYLNTQHHTFMKVQLKWGKKIIIHVLRHEVKSFF